LTGQRVPHRSSLTVSSAQGSTHCKSSALYPA
jgi:hypothetical protein